MTLKDIIAAHAPPASQHFGPSLEKTTSSPIPYSTFSKNDKIGQVVDWAQDAPADPRSSTLGAPRRAPGPKPGFQGTANQLRRSNAPEMRESASGGASSAAAPAAPVFGYVNEQDDASFSLVDSRMTGPGRRAGGNQSMNKDGFVSLRAHRTNNPRAQTMQNRSGKPGAPRAGGDGFVPSAGSSAGTQRKERLPPRVSSIQVGKDWTLKNEVDINKLSRVTLNVDTSDPVTLASFGSLAVYDASFDKVSTKAPVRITPQKFHRYSPNLSDDHIIQDFAKEHKANIYVSDAVLSHLMTATKTVLPWDLVFTRVGKDALFIDKRDPLPFDYSSVHEFGPSPPTENDRDPHNTSSSLAAEAAFVNYNFNVQAVKKNKLTPLGPENPFHSPAESDPLAPYAYQYREYTLPPFDDDPSVIEGSPLKVLVRTEADALMKTPASTEKPSIATLRVLTEYDPRSSDWRSALDHYRGAVLTSEIRANSAKLARWAIQALLAGADQIKLAYVSRDSPRDNARHSLLGVQTLRPSIFVNQINLNIGAGWGTLRAFADILFTYPEGKYALVKDPNHATLRLYELPQ